MKFSASEPGIIVSGVAHGALLVAILVGLSQAKQFDSPSEPIPVELISADQLNQVADGEEKAKQVTPQPHQVEHVADTVQPATAPPATAAQADPPPQPVPQPPEPPVRTEPPVQQPQPTVTAKTEPAAAAAAAPAPADVPMPQPRPAPPVEAKSPPVETTAPDAIEPPQPPQRTHVEAKVTPEPTPLPPTKTKPQPKVDPKQKTDLKLDQVAQLLDEQRIEDLSKPVVQPSPRPKIADVSPDPSAKFDPSSISKLLAKNAPQQQAATGRDVSTTASIGAANATAAKMSPSLSAELDGLMLDQYRQCWSYLGLTQKQYIPEIKVEYSQDGTLNAEPSLLNPPADPDLRSLAESALRAVRKCNPMRIPTQFAPYYQQWRARTLRFDPQDMSG